MPIYSSSDLAPKAGAISIGELQFSLLAPAAGTMGILLGVIGAMMRSSKVRYAVVDSQGKKVLEHPYAPWKPVGKPAGLLRCPHLPRISSFLA